MIPAAVAQILWRGAACAAAAAALVAGYLWWAGHQQDIGEERGAARVQAKWDQREKQLAAAALREAHDNARETLRRIEAQKRNQDAQDQALAVLAADRDRAERAGRVRERAHAAAAAEWSARLADSPTAEDLAAAGAAIRVCTELHARADHRAGVVAGFADASRAAGLKCEADYDALTPSPTTESQP